MKGNEKRETLLEGDFASSLMTEDFFTLCVFEKQYRVTWVGIKLGKECVKINIIPDYCPCKV